MSEESQERFIDRLNDLRFAKGLAPMAMSSTKKEEPKEQETKEVSERFVEASDDDDKQ